MELNFFFLCYENLRPLRSWFLIFWKLFYAMIQGGTSQVRFQPRLGRYLAAAAENVVSILDVETQACCHSLQVRIRQHWPAENSSYFFIEICTILLSFSYIMMTDDAGFKSIAVVPWGNWEHHAFFLARLTV